jgi:hypothetical protein
MLQMASSEPRDFQFPHKVSAINTLYVNEAECENLMAMSDYRMLVPDLGASLWLVPRCRPPNAHVHKSR